MGNCASSDEDGREKKNTYDVSRGDEKEEYQTSSYKKNSDSNTTTNNLNNQRNHVLTENKEPIKINEDSPQKNIKKDKPVLCDHSKLNEFALGLAKRILNDIQSISEGKDRSKIRVEETLFVTPTEETHPVEENHFITPTEETHHVEENLFVTPTEETHPVEEIHPVEETHPVEENLFVTPTEETYPVSDEETHFVSNEEVRISLNDINNVSGQNTDESRDLDGEQNIQNNLCFKPDQAIICEFALELAKKILHEAQPDSKDKDDDRIQADGSSSLKLLERSYSISNEDLKEPLTNDDEIHNIPSSNLSEFSQRMAFNILHDTEIEIIDLLRF